MHTRHELIPADASGYYYNRWQRETDAMQPNPPNITEGAHNPPTQFANKEKSKSLWKIFKTTLKH
eukprot:1160933-Pelagomonas_calceolata.AAC.5